MSTKIIIGDVRHMLKEIPDESIHCVVTSPPFFGLRDYGTAKWDGGEPGCQHLVRERQSIGTSTLDGGKKTTGHLQEGFRSECGKCGARRIDSQIGLEPTPDAYVAELVAVFREVRRVLRRDGTCWLNLGDSYSSSVTGSLGDKITLGGGQSNQAAGLSRPSKSNLPGLKPKDLIGIPWRVAFALQADGWWLRQDIIWSKPNPMPESVTDRCTKAHEYLFLLTKAERYFFDAAAIAEPVTQSTIDRVSQPMLDQQAGSYRVPGKTNGPMKAVDHGPTRNKRSVWEVTTQPFSEAHFATFPPALIEPCILAGCPAKACAKCGAPCVREVEERAQCEPQRKGGPKTAGADVHNSSNRPGGFYPGTKPTIGFSSSCSCGGETTAGTVLDPFGGAGTTGLVADRLQRNAILVELNPEYAAMARRRITDDGGMFAEAAE